MKRNKVIVLGTIHSQHLENKDYSLEELKAIVESVSPDLILVELPPFQFTEMLEEFKEKKTITNFEMPRYPEYPLVILPYAIDKKIIVIPFSGWSQKVVDERDNKLEEIKNQPIRKNDWASFIKASELSEEMFAKENKSLDPAWVHTDRFDELMEIKLSVFNQLFNDDLEEGGWENINDAHYGNIDNALKSYSNRGMKILITIGAGHKGWMKRKLRERIDIELVDFIRCYI